MLNNITIPLEDETNLDVKIIQEPELEPRLELELRLEPEPRLEPEIEELEIEELELETKKKR